MKGGIITRSGALVRSGAEQAGFTLALLGRAVACAPRALTRARRFRAVVDQFHFCGVKAVTVTLVVGVFTGMIIGLQAGIAFKEFGQAERVAYIVADTMCRAMGPIITAIILTAMVGSAIAAEIGTMKVSEEIDALEVMSIDPVRMLAMPRIVALTLTTFLLTVMVDIVGILGGAVVGASRLGVPMGRYVDLAAEALEGRGLLGILPKDLWTGLTMALVFGAIISSVACAQGFLARGGALGVGRAVRKTVVASIILILVAGYLMTALFYA